jgi:enamine deaminase RidA (YjgF/YER057c/UK114 family)
MQPCLLAGIGPDQNSSPCAGQTKQTLDNLAKALAQDGFSFADMVRTWFFIEDILSWYDEFNQVRTLVYSGTKFHTGSPPASTGIGGCNPAGTALVAGAWAMQPLNPASRVTEVASPLQCPAPAYGSSFSRAIEISSPAGRRLLISGTASISHDGKTVCAENAGKQMDLTMEVVEAILHSRGFKFSDLTRSTAYFKYRPDVRVFTEWRTARHLSSLPAVLANCDVCRDDLLFELEADAWRANKAP